MRFRILGPLEIAGDDALRTLPAGAERAVLVLLLLSAGRVVPADTLVDALWGEDLPANAANALQGRVSRLRRALADAGLGDGLILTRAPGYLADVDPEQVDAHRFTRLVADARRLAADHGSAAEALLLYDKALALWRGDSLAELGEQSWSRAEATRLVELRLTAVEERVDLRLRAGQHTELVAELEVLTARHPLREHLYGQLMLALYRSGRQADALAVYQRICRTLSDELGLDPSGELRELERAILRQDPTVGAPAPASVTERTNLPARLTSFVGRSLELAEIRGLLAGNRLVTLTGPGGAGKTSLAIEAASGIADRYTDGIWLVRLAGLGETARVPRAVADALGVPDGGGTADEELIRYLRDRRAMVVLDNCEHLVDACASLVESLLVSCGRLRVLATSREPLAVPGEVQLTVPPLDIPPLDAAPNELPAYDAVRLFIDRARSALPSFTLDAAAAPHVGRICRQLDGIPLAIELAATRVRTLPVSEIAARLGDRFSLLTTGPRTAEARQQTLRAAVDWSHQLLTEPERVLFRRLSVFRGGWNLDAAEQVCADAGIDQNQIVGLLTNLVDRSLVVTDHDERARFRMLETLRHYALGQLAHAGEVDRVEAAHARYFTAVAEDGEPRLRGTEQGRWLRWLERERDNLRAALSWCHDHADASPDLGLRLAAALGWFWYFASHQDGQHDLTAMLTAASHGSPLARARALQAHSVVARPRSCIVHPSQACATTARESLDIFTRLGEAHHAAMSKTLLAVEGIGTKDVPGALALLADANQGFLDAGGEWGQALVLFVEMELHATLGALDKATGCAGRALDHFRRLADHWGISAIQYHLGLALHRAGRLRAALDVYQAALVEGQEVGLANTVQYLLANMGHVTLLLGDPERAERHFAEARVVARQLGAEGSPLAALGEGLLARARGDLPAARRHHAEALRMLTAPETRDWAGAAMTGLGYVAELAGDLDDAERHHRDAWRAATAVGHLGAGAGAAALEGLACVAAARADGHTAAALLGAAARWRAEHGRPASPLELADIQRAVDRARDLLGHDAYQAASAAAPTPTSDLLTLLPVGEPSPQQPTP
jgi:predicted ATPase/DNA-binding SARP family transcriptional activator